MSNTCVPLPICSKIEPSSGIRGPRSKSERMLRCCIPSGVSRSRAAASSRGPVKQRVFQRVFQPLLLRSIELSPHYDGILQRHPQEREGKGGGAGRASLQ
eukprot:gene13382-biopygen9088